MFAFSSAAELWKAWISSLFSFGCGANISGNTAAIVATTNTYKPKEICTENITLNGFNGGAIQLRFLNKAQS